MDAASGAAVYALGIQKGDHVLDLCAAPGYLIPILTFLLPKQILQIIKKGKKG